MQFYIKRTVLVYFYLLTIQVACFPGMLNENDDIAKKLQCWISNNVDELLQIEKLNSEEFGLFRTQIGHAIIFEDFKQYSLGQNVMTFINKKVSLKYIMNLRFQQSVNIDHSLQEGLNFVYIKTKLNFQQEGIILHIFNIYQQGQLKQIIQETNNGIVYSFSFHEQQDYYVQIIFATLIQNKFNTNHADIVPFIKSLQKDYQVCSILECKQDIYLPQTLNLTNINQLEPKYIKQAYFRTSQSIQYYDMINSIYFGQINVEDDKILNRVEFSVDCIQLMQNQEDRDGITLEWNQYFCINNLVYHFKIKKIQNQKHSKNYFLLFQVNHDINTQELLLQLFNLLDNLKCLQGDHISHNLQKLKEKNSSFIQQFQTSEKLMEDENLDLQVEMKIEDQIMEVPTNSFQEETIFIQKDEMFGPQNKQSTLLTEQDSHSETIDFLEMPQFYGQISLVQQNIQEQLSEDDIFSQPLQVEEALHQKRLNQIEQEEKKTQEIQEAITFEQNQQQQQKQQNEDIVFDEYNQDQLERQRISQDINKIENQVENQRYQQNNQPQESNHQHHHHHHQEKQDETNDYERYELHRSHHTHNHHHHKNHHHHHEQQEFSDNDYSNQEYDNPIDGDYLEYQHHHHRKHHHKYYQQEDQNILSNQNRYNLRGSQQNKYQDEEPEVVDKIVIEFNFQQREVKKENDQPKQPKEKDDSIKDSQKEKTQKMENQQLKNSDQDQSKNNQDKQTSASKNGSNQQRQQEEDASSQDKNKQKDKQKTEDKQISQDKQKSVDKENDRNSDSEQNKNDEEIEDEETQKNKEHQENVKNKQKQKTQKEKEDKQKEEEQEEDKDKEKEEDKEKEKEEENQEQQEEDQPSNKNKNKDKNNKNNNKDQEDNENEENQENQENEVNKQEDQENQESNQDEVEKQDDQKENQDKPKQKDKDKSDKEKAKKKKKEDCKKNKKQKEEAEEEAKDAQQDEEKQQEDEQQEEKNEDIEVEEQAEEIYDDYGRYKPNDPFYEHRHSKRGRVPFNYPTRDPYQDMFEDEMFWRYNMMKRQQARFPFNGYPYRHRGRSIDHSPFPHVNSYYKQHPFQKQTYNVKPLFGRDFYPEAGYGMSRVIDAYKGRYTDPEQVLREISMRHQQEKMWRDSLRQYREAVGYSRGPSEYFDDYVPWQYEVPQGSRETFQPQDQFSPFEFNKEIQEETHDYLNDPQYKFRQGKRELVKNFSKPNNKANYDNYEPRDCFVIYDQCNFEGNRLDLCGEYPDIPQYLNNFKVFSFIVPDNLKIKLFQSTKFQDDLQDVEGTQECLEIPYELVPAQ